MKAARIRRTALVALGLMGATAAVWAWSGRAGRSSGPPTGYVYSASGFGGFVPAQAKPGGIEPQRRRGAEEMQRRGTQPLPDRSVGASLSSTAVNADPLRPAYDAYGLGQYERAEQEARKVAGSTAIRVQNAKAPVQADLLIAYCAARRKDLQKAREWFGKVRQEAAALPDHGKRNVRFGEPLPTLEEEGAFQHAVCTQALGEPREAESEYMAIMKDYPESPLVHGAIKRIAGLHHRNIPKEAEEVWKEAMRVAAQREKTRKAAAAICGPECLAELLRRRVESKDGRLPQHSALSTQHSILGLAREMGTNDRGTSLLALAEAARRRGFATEGLDLSWKGLQEQKLPLVALLGPEHFVLVERVGADGATIWDPDLHGVGQAGRRAFSAAQWQKVWGGIALAVQ